MASTGRWQGAKSKVLTIEPERKDGRKTSSPNGDKLPSLTIFLLVEASSSNRTFQEFVTIFWAIGLQGSRSILIRRLGLLPFTRVPIRRTWERAVGERTSRRD